jgi:hypothetical protein
MLFLTSDTAATIEEFFTEIYGYLRNGNYAQKPKDGENSRSEGAEFDILPARKRDSIEVASFPRIAHKILSSELPITQTNNMQRPQNDPPASIAFRKEHLKLGRREGLLKSYITEDPQWMVPRVWATNPIQDISEPSKFPSADGMASLTPFAGTMEICRSTPRRRLSWPLWSTMARPRKRSRNCWDTSACPKLISPMTLSG